MNFRCALFAPLALTLLLLGMPASSSALTPPFEVQASKSADGPYTADGQNATIRPGKTKLFYWRVESGSPNNQSMTFDDAATDSNAGYVIKWYKGKRPKASKNITSQIDSGYPFTLRGDQTRFFTAKVRAQQDPETLCLGGQATNTALPYSDSAYFSINGICT